MQRETLADIYWELRREFNMRREISYIYHTSRLENSYLRAWATRKVLTTALFRKRKKFRKTLTGSNTVHAIMIR